MFLAHIALLLNSFEPPPFTVQDILCIGSEPDCLNSIAYNMAYDLNDMIINPLGDDYILTDKDTGEYLGSVVKLVNVEIKLN